IERSKRFRRLELFFHWRVCRLAQRLPTVTIHNQEHLMSLATVIAPHLPYLRRFARALTGSQASGDAYVAAALEALVEDPDSFPDHMAPRAALFQVFLKLWNSVEVNSERVTDADGGSETIIERKLEAITPRPRQAFLLVSVE